MATESERLPITPSPPASAAAARAAARASCSPASSSVAPACDSLRPRLQLRRQRRRPGGLHHLRRRLHRHRRSPRSTEALFHPPPFVHLLLWIPATHHPLARAAPPVQGDDDRAAVPPRRGRGPGQDDTRRWRHRLAFVVLMLALTGALRRARHLAGRSACGEKEALIAAVAARLDAAAGAAAAGRRVGRLRPRGLRLPPGHRHRHLRARPRPSSSSPASPTPRGQLSGPGYWVMTPLRARPAAASSSSIAASSRRTSAAAFADGEGAPTAEVTITGIARTSEEAVELHPRPRYRQAHRVGPQHPAPRRLARSRRWRPLAPVYVDSAGRRSGRAAAGRRDHHRASPTTTSATPDLVRLRHPHPGPARLLAASGSAGSRQGEP